MPHLGHPVMCKGARAYAPSPPAPLPKGEGVSVSRRTGEGSQSVKARRARGAGPGFFELCGSFGQESRRVSGTRNSDAMKGAARFE